VPEPPLFFLARCPKNSDDGQGYRILAAWRGREPVALAGYRIDENLGALTLDFTPAQLEKLDAAADAVVGSRSADPNWVSQGRE